jgi:hypothetical protein
MQTFTFGQTRWRTIRAFGKNPLVRISDRIEAVVVVSAVAISLLAAPVAGAIGTAAYDARSRIYSEEAQTRRPVSAIVTTAARSATVVRPYMGTAIVEARWRSGGVERTESFATKRPAAVGDQIDIWVNDKGERVIQPSHFQAAFEAVCVAVSLWLAMMGVATAMVALVRRLLDRHRDIEWEREIGGLAGRRSAD